MKNIFISAILALCSVTAAGAQTTNVADSTLSGTTDIERFEGELFGGMSLPIGEAEYGTKKMG